MSSQVCKRWGQKFYKIAAIVTQIYFRFLIWTCLTFRKVNVIRLSACQISTKYLNPRLRYYYVLFLKTNGRHIEILLPVSILTFYCHRHVILYLPTKFYANWIIADGVMTSYWLYKMAAIASQIYFQCLIWPRLTFRKVQSCRHTKFRPNMSFEPQSTKIGPAVRPARTIEKKGQDRTVKKVTKALYFTHLGRSPHCTDFHRNLHSSCCPRRNHVCKLLNWNFQG